MNVPKAFGLWTVKERENTAAIPEEEPARIDGKPVYCPFCKEPMKMWLEGCTLWHVECRQCDFCLTLKVGDGEIFEKLVTTIYE